MEVINQSHCSSEGGAVGGGGGWGALRLAARAEQIHIQNTAGQG